MKDTKKGIAEQSEMGLSLEELIRRGARELIQKAIEVEKRSHWRRANELFGTHPPTYKRILMLEEMEEELKKGSLPPNIYQFV